MVQNGSYFPMLSPMELIANCERKAKNPRALFHAPVIAQMIDYAGCPPEYNTPEEWVRRKGFHSVSSEMKELVELAKERLRIS